MNYFFMFSNGEYSDYSVNGLYVCDHEVTHEEWEAHLAVYDAAMEDRKEEFYISFGERTGFGTSIDYRGRVSLPRDFNQSKHWGNSPEAKAYRIWLQDNDPEKTFQEKHVMVEVGFMELSRGY